MKLQHAFSPQSKPSVTFYVSCISGNKEMASFIFNQVLELICSFSLASIYLSSRGICFIRATMWKTQTQRSICFLQEQCEQSINVILMPDEILCDSRDIIMKRLTEGLVSWSLDFFHGRVVKLAQQFQKSRYGVDTFYNFLLPEWGSLQEFQIIKIL